MVRIKERYLLVNILYPEDESSSSSNAKVPDLLVYHRPTADSLTTSALLKAIRSQVTSLWGDYGAGAVERSLQVKYLSNATSTFILRISRAHHRIVRSALAFMNRIPTKDGRPCVFRVVHVSGTIRKVEKESIRRTRLLMLAAKEQAAGSESSHALEKLLAGDRDLESGMGPGDSDGT
jgi:ribonuclease P/MRP protein subunit POP5